MKKSENGCKTSTGEEEKGQRVDSEIKLDGIIMQCSDYRYTSHQSKLSIYSKIVSCKPIILSFSTLLQTQRPSYNKNLMTSFSHKMTSYSHRMTSYSHKMTSYSHTLPAGAMFWHDGLHIMCIPHTQTQTCCKEDKSLETYVSNTDE